MSQPTVGILFSASLPAATPGYQIATPQTDGALPASKFNFQTPATGGAVVRTTSYTAVAADCGIVQVFNSATPVTLTLPAAAPFLKWTLPVQNVGAGVLTINRNGLLIDTVAANLTLAQASGVNLATDATNYLTMRGLSNTTGLATQAGVQQESYIAAADTGAANAYVVTQSPVPTIGLYSGIVFKASHGNTGPSTVTWNGTTYPLTKNGTAPLSAGDILAGQIVHGTADGASNVQISAVPAATVLQPNIRGSNSTTSTTGSITISLSGGTLATNPAQAGDLVLLHVANGWSPSVPSGWATISPVPPTSVWFAFTASKILTSGDISTGSITISTGGVFNAIAELYVFIGATGGVREFVRSDTAGGNYTTTLTTSSAVLATDVGVYFGSVRTGSGTGSVSISPGSTLQTPSLAGQAYGALANEAMPGGATAVGFTVTNANAASQTVVIVQGGATSVGSVTSVSATVPAFLTVVLKSYEHASHRHHRDQRGCKPCSRQSEWSSGADGASRTSSR